MSKNLQNVPSWNLTDFYSSILDPKIEKDLRNIKNSIVKFKKSFEGKVLKLSAKKLYEVIKEYEKISEKIGKISSYSYLIYAGDLSNQKNIAFYQNISEKVSQFSTELVFFDLELNQIKDVDLKKKLKASKDLASYQPYIRDVRAFKKYYY